MALKDLAPPVRPKATLVYSPHPLLVDAGRVVQQTVAIRGESVGDYLRRHGIDTDKPLVVSVDGKPVVRDEWELLDAEEGMLVAARGALAGGDGGGSQVVAMVAMIALAVFAPYLSGVLVAQVGGIGAAAALGSTGLAIVTAATTGIITLAGSMLINKLMPAPKMDLGKGLGALQASSNYSITGGQNRARPFEPLALVLGTHRVFFDLAGRPYSTYQGEDQYLYQVFCVGLVGPHGAYDVSDLRIGTTLLSTYEGVTTETSIGTMPAMMPANVDTVAGAAITAEAPQAVRTTSPNTTKIELDFTAMSYRARSDGDIEGALLDWKIEYCATGTGAWQLLETVSTNGNGQKPIRLSRSYAVTAGTYDVRVTGITLSTSSKFIRQLTWDAVKCYQPDDGYYEGQQFLAVKIKATGQLNGVVDRLNGIVKMPTAPGVYSSNPADLLTLFAIGHKAADGQPLWGGQLSSSALDVAGLDAWRTWCAAKGLTFNAVVDSQRSVWDILQSITRCGRGSPTWAPGKLGVVWDADNQPVVASFNMANIKRGTFEVAYQSEAPVDEVVLTYVNAADDYAADTVRALAPSVTSPTKSATIELWGCTNQAMAVKECHLALAENLYRTRLVSWETDMEGLVVTRGDVVSLSHDLTQWGKSGRLVSGTTTALELDQAITLDSAGTWIGLIAPDGTQYTCRVAYQAGDHSSITLLDPLPIAPDADNPIDWRYTADYVATPGKLVKIVSIVPSGMDSVKLTAVDEYDEYYASENGTYTPPTKREWASNQPQIRSLGVTEEIVKSGGSHTTKLIISWSEAGNVASRLVRYSIDGGPLEIAGHANGSRFELMVPDAGTVMIVVTLYDGLGQTSSGAQASVTHTLQGLAYAPFELASFTGEGGLFQNRLSWVYQGDINDVKHVEVWGGNLNDRSLATLLTVQAAPANGWLHTGLQTGQTWFYWARAIDHKLRPSEFLPLSATAGLAVTTSSDPSDLLDALTGSITEDALYLDLSARIDLIDAPTTGAHAKISALESQVTTLQADVAEISGTPEYDNTTTYVLDDIVKYLGGLYRATQTTTGNLPTNTTYWQKIGDYASLGDAVAGHAVILDDHETRIDIAEGDLVTEATQRQTLATQLRGSYTGTDVSLLTSGLVFNERQARSAADASEVSSRQALATKMTGASDPSGLTLATLSSGLLYDERQARSSADATEVTARQALSAKMTGLSDPSGKVLADLTSGLIFEEKTARVSAVDAVASQVSVVEASFANTRDFQALRTYNFTSGAEGWLPRTGSALAHDAAGFVVLSAGTNTSHYLYRNFSTSERIDGASNPILRMRFRTSNGVAYSNVPFYFGTTAGVASETRRKNFSIAAGTDWQVVEIDMAGVADWGTSPVTQIRFDVGRAAGMTVDVDWVSIGARAPGASVEDVAAVSAAITAEQTARADADSALASDVTTLQTTVNGHTTSIQTNATSIDGIEAKYTVKIDNNGYVSGYGLISTANNGTPTSSFVILADKFAVVTPGKTPKVPFVVGTVNGASAVGIDGTLVVDGSIVANKIDTRGLTVKDAAGNVILSSGVPLDWAMVGGTNKPQDGATVGATWGSNIGGQPSNDDLLNAGANLAPNPDLKTGSDTTANGWAMTSTGAITYVLRLVDPSLGPGWDKSQPFFYTNASGTTAQTRWWSDPIPVDAGKNYTISAWARSLSGSGASSYLGVMCLNDAGTELGYVYPPGLNGFSHTTTWTQRKGVFGPGYTAFASGTTKVRLVWWGTYLAAGANLATRFGFNEGVVPTRSVIPADAFPITPSNASTYIANAAIGKLQVDLASANRLTVGQANIETAAVGTLTIAGNAVVAPVYYTIPAWSYWSDHNSSVTNTRTLGSITTDPYGNGQVIITISPNGYGSHNYQGVGGSAYTGPIGIASLYAVNGGGGRSVSIRLLRNGLVIWEQAIVQAVQTGDIIQTQAYVHMLRDTPGAGVYCLYQIQFYSNNVVYHDNAVFAQSHPPLAVMLTEFKR